MPHGPILVGVMAGIVTRLARLPYRRAQLISRVRGIGILRACITLLRRERYT